MPELRRSQDGGFVPHHHIFYLDDETGESACAVVQEHDHVATWTPPVPAQEEVPEQTDPNTGQVISEAVPAQEAVPGYWTIEPSPFDGHTHELLDDYPFKTPPKKEDDDEIVKDALELWSTAKELEGESQEKGDEADGFYFGDKQWDELQRMELKEQKRACLTINYTAPRIDEICGHQRQNRTDIHYSPVEGGDQRTCDLYNVTTKVILENCFYPREESKVFQDAVIRGRGVLSLYLDNSKNIFGDLKVERLSPQNFGCGEHDKEDLEDCEFTYKERFYSLAKVQATWPDKADEISADFDLCCQGDIGRQTQYTFDHYAKGNQKNARLVYKGETMVDVARKEYRVVEVWRRKYVDATIAVRYANEFVESLYLWQAEDIKQVQTLPGFVVIRRTEKKIRITKFAGATLLSDENTADLPVDDFFQFPVYCYKRGTEFRGKIEFIKDVQREINKRRSQAIDIGNRCVSYVSFYDSGTFPDDNAKEQYRKMQSTPGALLEVSDQSRPPSVREGGEFPSTLVQLEELSEKSFDRILNISVREPGANTSAAAILQAVKQKLIGNEFLFESLFFAKQKLGQTMPHAIRKFYSPDRIYRMVAGANARKPVKVGDKMFLEWSKAEIIEILSNADVTTFDTIVTESSYSPTTRMAIFLILSEAQKNGVSISPKVLIRFMEAPDSEKEEILADLEQESQAAAEQAKMTNDTEVEKTLIAHKVFTPQIREKYGIRDEDIPMELPKGAAVPATSFQENTNPEGGISQGA